MSQLPIMPAALPRWTAKPSHWRKNDVDWKYDCNNNNNNNTNNNAGDACRLKLITFKSIIIIIIIFFFFLFYYPRYLESRGLKAYSKNSCNGHWSGSHTKLSRRRTELKRWRVIARHWKRKVDSRRSLDLVLILRSSAEMRATADELRVPTFSNAMGWQM